MILRTETNSEQVVVWLFGDIDVDVATSIREELFSYIDKDFKQFVIHFDHVGSLDSSGLGVLVAVQKRVGPGNVILKGLKGELKCLIEKGKLNRLFEMN